MEKLCTVFWWALHTLFAVLHFWGKVESEVAHMFNAVLRHKGSISLHWEGDGAWEGCGFDEIP